MRSDSERRATEKFNKKNYDNIAFRARKGANAATNELARLAGRSKAEYIRTLIASDARKRGRDDLARKVGGGG